MSVARAQFTGACCFPVTQTCAIMSPYDCVQAGGDFLGLSSTCPTTDACDRRQHFGVGMSQVAARRLLREGVVHTLHVGDSLPVYEADHPMWDLLNYGVIIAPEIYVSVLEAGEHDAEFTPQESAEYCAAQMLTRAEAAMTAFAGAHPGKPFYWTLHLAGLGAGWTWQVAEDSQLPILTHHELDVVDDKLARREYVSIPGHVGSIHNAYEFTASSNLALLAQFSEDYFLEPWPATMTITDHLSNGDRIGDPRTAEISGYDRINYTFTLASPITTPATGTDHSKFTITRTDHNYAGLLPCYFFKNGAEEMGNWVQAFCAYMGDEENWPGGLPEPVAVIISDEDMGEVSVDWNNYKAYLNDSLNRDENEEFTIDGQNTLREWHLLHAPGEFDEEDGTYIPDGSPYSPVNAVAHSYLLATLQTAYNYHREQSTWQHFRALWPKARLSQYQLGNGYGVDESIATEVPIGPGESSYHGQRTWHGPVSWDEYNVGISSTVPEFPFQGDSQVVPIGYKAGSVTTGTAGEGTGYAADRFPVASSLSISPDYYLGLTTLPGRPIKLYVEFLTPPNDGYVYEVADWDSGVFELTEELEEPSVADQAFRLYYPFDTYVDYAAYDSVWPHMETFCARYGDSMNATGLVSTAKKWAAECARAQTRALPDNPYSIYYGPGEYSTGYNSVSEQVSILSTYPYKGFTSQDGWLNGEDWGAIASQAMDYGVNHFVWFFPVLAQSSNNYDVLTDAMDAIRIQMSSNWAVYANIACIADWEMDGDVDAADATAFLDALAAGDPAADLNNDGILNGADEAIYNPWFCAGGCAPIQSPGCSNEEDCLLADWCADGGSGVEDIFCFLEDWFADDYEAQNFGGTPGVPAIFAFLTLWFSVGVADCDS